MSDTLDIAKLRVLYYSEGFASMNREFDAAKASATKNFGSISRTVGTSMTVMGAGITAAMGLATKSALDFEAGMRNVGTLGVQDIGKLREGVLDYSTAMGQNATQATEDLYQILSKGIPEANALTVLESSAKAAAAGVGETSDALDLGTSILNSYSLDVGQFEHVMGLAVTAVKLGSTTIGDMGTVIGRVAPLASQAGVSIEELFSAIAGITSTGTKTSEAISGMKAAIANIIKPSKEAADLAEELHLKFDATALSSKGLAGFLDEITKATDGNVEKMSQLFGSVEAVNSVLALTSGGGAAKFKEALGQMDDGAKTLNETFEVWKKENPEFAYRQAKAELGRMAIEMGTVLIPIMRDVVVVLKPVMAGFSALTKTDIGRWAIIAVAGFGVLMFTLGPIVRVLPTLIAGFKMLTTMQFGATLTSAAAGTTAVGTAATGATVGIGGMAAAAAIATGTILAVVAAIAFMAINLTMMVKTLGDYAKATRHATAAEADQASTLEQLRQRYESYGITIDDVAWKTMSLAEKQAWADEAKKQRIALMGEDVAATAASGEAEGEHAEMIVLASLRRQEARQIEAEHFEWSKKKESELEELSVEIAEASDRRRQVLLERYNGLLDERAAAEDAWLAERERQSLQEMDLMERLAFEYTAYAQSETQTQEVELGRQEERLHVNLATTSNALKVKGDASIQAAKKEAEERARIKEAQAEQEKALTEKLGETGKEALDKQLDALQEHDDFRRMTEEEFFDFKQGLQNDDVNGATQYWAELQRTTAQGLDGATGQYEQFNRNISQMMASLRQEIQHTLDMSQRGSPSMNDNIARGFLGTYSIIGGALDRIGGMYKGARAQFAEAMQPIPVSTSAQAGQALYRETEQARRVFWPDSAATRTNAQPARATAAPQNISITVNASVSNDYDVNRLAQQLAARIQQQRLLQGA